jgi:hypothetical protein
VIVDLTRIGTIDDATRNIVFHLARQAFENGKRIVLVDPRRIFSQEERRSLVPMAFTYDSCDEALEDAEENILAQSGVRAKEGDSFDLEGMDLLQGLSEQAVADLKLRAETREFPENARIIEQGGPSDEIYFLSRGLVGIVLRQEETGTVKKIASFTPGMSFGELSFLQQLPRTADVIAVTRIKVYALSNAAIEAFRQIYPTDYQRILLNVLQSMSERLVRANREVAALR